MLSALSLLPLAKWLPDETLYSWASRQHELTGNSSASATCHQLFGHAQQGSAHDLPSRIDALVQRTAGQLGSGTEIIFEHTLAPFYFPFADPIKADNAISAMRGNGLGGTKFSLGLLTSGFRAHHPLKACFECMKEDLSQYASAYWHLSHQLPGVWVCRRHAQPLAEATVKSTGVERFLWRMPSSQVLRASGYSVTPALQRLALVASSIHRAGRRHFAPIQVRALYREQARRLGYGHGDESLKLESMARAYAAEATPLRAVPEFQALPATATDAYTQLTKMLGTCAPAHSLRHASVISWLFGSFEAFESAYDKRNDVDQPSPVAEVLPVATATLRDRIAEGLRTDEASVTAIATRLQVDVTTVMAVRALAFADRPLQRRPKVLTATRRAEVIAALQKGDDKSAAAKLAVVSISTVTRLLRTEPGLQDQWHAARTMRARIDARRAWQEIVGSNPLLGVKALRLLEPASYAWLYRNDRAWLEARKPSNRNKTATVPRVQWDARDRELADSVNRVALELSSERGVGPFSLWEIYQRLPDLKAKLRKLDRLPLTTKALSHVVGRRRRRTAPPA